MKTKFIFLIAAFGLTAATASANLLITGVFDGPLTGGNPKGVELYVLSDIADLSIYGIGSANNGGGTDGEEFTFSGSATAGSFIYAASESVGFNNFFGFTPTFDAGSSMSINGDDAIELFLNGNVIDTFGDINVDGTGQTWDSLDGWAYRNDATGPDGTTFVESNWTFSGTNQLEGGLTNNTTTSPFPIGTYAIPEPSVAALLMIGMGFLFRFIRKQK